MPRDQRCAHAMSPPERERARGPLWANRLGRVVTITNDLEPAEKGIGTHATRFSPPVTDARGARAVLRCERPLDKRVRFGYTYGALRDERGPGARCIENSRARRANGVPASAEAEAPLQPDFFARCLHKPRTRRCLHKPWDAARRAATRSTGRAADDTRADKWHVRRRGFVPACRRGRQARTRRRP